jgi:hypothetical protein
MSRVTRGKNVVDTMTCPGYSNLVAVTSIWQLLEHEIDGSGVEVALAVGVCTIVVGTIRVVMNDCVMRIVETDVVADRVSVIIEVGPSKDMVLSTVDADCVIVDTKFDVSVLAGNSLRIVVVVSGMVIVDRIVLGGSWVVAIEVVPGSWMVDMITSPGKVTVENNVLGGNCVVTVEVVPGNSKLVVTISPGNKIVETTVLAGSWVVTVETLGGSVRVVVIISPGRVTLLTMVSGGEMLTNVVVT